MPDINENINGRSVRIEILTWSAGDINRCRSLIHAVQDVIETIFTLSDRVKATMELIGKYYTEEVDGELAARLVAESLNSDPGRAYEQCRIMKRFVERLGQHALTRLDQDREMAENAAGVGELLVPGTVEDAAEHGSMTAEEIDGLLKFYDEANESLMECEEPEF